MLNPPAVLDIDIHKLLWDFDIQTNHLISARRQHITDINKKKRTCEMMDFAVPADYRMKLKESKKKDKNLDLAREFKKKIWNMKVMIIPIVISAFGTVTWKLEDEWRPSKLQHCWERPEYWEESWKLEETCCHSYSSERPSANADVKKSKGVNNNNNNNNNNNLSNKKGGSGPTKFQDSVYASIQRLDERKKKVCRKTDCCPQKQYRQHNQQNRDN